MKVHNLVQEQLEFLWEHEREWLFKNRPYWVIHAKLNWVLYHREEWLSVHSPELYDGSLEEVPERIVDLLEEMEKKKDESS